MNAEECIKILKENLLPLFKHLEEELCSCMIRIQNRSLRRQNPKKHKENVIDWPSIASELNLIED